MGNTAKAILYNEFNAEISSQNLGVIFDHDINK